VDTQGAAGGGGEDVEGIQPAVEVEAIEVYVAFVGHSDKLDGGCGDGAASTRIEALAKDSNVGAIGMAIKP
jgi:hypothetical protein